MSAMGGKQPLAVGRWSRSLGGEQARSYKGATTEPGDPVITLAIIASTIAANSPATPAAAAVQVAPAAARSATAPAKMDCCKDGCSCCGKEKDAKAHENHKM
jgi:hypothetical protein